MDNTELPHFDSSDPDWLEKIMAASSAVGGKSEPSAWHSVSAASSHSRDRAAVIEAHRSATSIYVARAQRNAALESLSYYPYQTSPPVASTTSRHATSTVGNGTGGGFPWAPSALDAFSAVVDVPVQLESPTSGALTVQTFTDPVASYVTALSTRTVTMTCIDCPAIDSIPSGKRSGYVLRCDWPGCTDGTLFSRPFELKRHMEGHMLGRFHCPVVGCKRVGHRSFGRVDKLKDHVRRGHGAETLFECIVTGCATAPGTKDDMRNHLDLHKLSTKILGTDLIRHMRAFD